MALRLSTDVRPPACGEANAKLGMLVLLGVLTALHIAAPRTRALSIAVFASSLLVVLLGVALSH